MTDAMVQDVAASTCIQFGVAPDIAADSVATLTAEMVDGPDRCVAYVRAIVGVQLSWQSQCQRARELTW